MRLKRAGQGAEYRNPGAPRDGGFTGASRKKLKRVCNISSV
jgi:hypothetical protein